MSIVVVLLALALITMQGRYVHLKKSIDKGKVSMYDKLRDSEEDKARLKRQLTQNVAHELKTPVSSIQGYLETIVSNPDIDAQTKEQFIQRCYAQSRRLSSLLADISTLNKLDDAPQGYEFEAVNIPDLLQTIRRDVSMQMEANHVTFRSLVEPGVEVNGNPSLLYSIFRNLTDNSIAYGGEEVTITVQVLSESTDFYTFSFSDNGPGVAPEHIPHLFERFYRIDKGRSRKMGGTGLGLAIVKNSVLLHRGNISVRLGIAGGLEFVFTLPKAA
uniref:sensor histidine kinase n=1 Tax=Candidatus Cryptobacteroides bacterium TaxID=3085639 RepID=UPI0040251855